jgi:hypothetical protein
MWLHQTGNKMEDVPQNYKNRGRQKEREKYKKKIRMSYCEILLALN